MANSISEEQVKQIIDLLRQSKRQIDVANELGIKRSIVNYYARHLKKMDSDERSKNYFNVDAYYRLVPTI